MKTVKLLSVMVSLLAILATSHLAFGQTGNTKLGTGAGDSITTGDNNTLIGENAGTNITSTSESTFVGFEAGFNTLNSGDNDNTFIGSKAGRANTGWDNTFVGARAGEANTTAGDNTFVGTEAGKANTTGFDNTFVGEQAGYNSTTGDDNTFIGEDAGYSNTEGEDNTAIGSTALRSITTGRGNTAVGKDAGYSITTAFNNTVVGFVAGEDMGAGMGNTALGAFAGTNIEHADFNTFVGFMAGWDNNRTNSTVNANSNTYLGFATGMSNREGSNNVILGAFSDMSDIDETTAEESVQTSTFWNGNPPSRSSWDLNVSNVVGVGTSIRITGDNSIAIGYEASNSSQNSIAIGNLSTVPDSSNYSVAIGSSSTVSGNNRMVLGGTTAATRVSVGIGTNAPNQNASLELAEIDKGFLINRLTTAQRATLGTSLGTTDEAMMVYDTDDQKLYSWDGTQWVAVDQGAGVGTDDQNLTGASLTGTTLQVDIENGTSASVDLAALQDGTGTDDQNLTGASLTGTTLQVNIENGTSASVDLAALQDGTGTDDQTLSLSSNNLSIEDGNSVDLSGFLDNTDDQNLTGASLTGTTLQVDIENGSSASVDLAALQDGTGTDDQNLTSPSLTGTTLQVNIENGSSASVDLAALQDGTGTDDQTLSLSSNNLSIEDGNSVDLSGFLDNTDDQNLTGASLTGTTLQVNIEDGTSASVDLAALQDGTGTDDQTLSLSSNNLSIEDANSVDLSDFLDNTDGQNLTGASLTGTTLQVDIENGTSASVDLAALQDGTGTDDQNLTGASLTGTTLQVDIENGTSASVDLAALQDGTGTDDQTLLLSGTSLSIEDGNSVNLSGFLDNTDNQDLSLTGNTLNLSFDPTSVDLSGFLDNTDGQTLSLSGTSLSIEDGNSVDLSGFLDNTDGQNLTGASLTGTTLQVDIENGSSASVDLAALQDAAIHIVQAGAKNIGSNKKDDDESKDKEKKKNVQISHGTKEANAGVVSLRDGKILGFSVAVDETIKKGTADVNVTINDSVVGQTITLSVGSDDGFVEFPTPLSVNAGDRLSFNISPSAFKPKKADATLSMWVSW